MATIKKIRGRHPRKMMAELTVTAEDQKGICQFSALLMDLNLASNEIGRVNVRSVMGIWY